MPQIVLASASRIGKSGRRFAEGCADDSDRTVISQYLEHADLIQADVVRKLALHLRPRITRDGKGWAIGGRAKTAITLQEKLQRTPEIKLPYIDDIAGVRVVGDILRSEQRKLALELAILIGNRDAKVKIVDRCETPRQGYRAVHAVVRVDRVHVEIQVRTPLQHLWAEFYERAADEFGRWIRYYPVELTRLDPKEVGIKDGSPGAENLDFLAKVQEFSKFIDTLESGEEETAESWAHYGEIRARGRADPAVLVDARRVFRQGEKFEADFRKSLLKSMSALIQLWDEHKESL